jgi:hypothetical protein
MLFVSRSRSSHCQSDSLPLWFQAELGFLHALIIPEDVTSTFLVLHMPIADLHSTPWQGRCLEKLLLKRPKSCIEYRQMLRLSNVSGSPLAYSSKLRRRRCMSRISNPWSAKLGLDTPIWICTYLRSLGAVLLVEQDWVFSCAAVASSLDECLKAEHHEKTPGYCDTAWCFIRAESCRGTYRVDLGAYILGIKRETGA